MNTFYKLAFIILASTYSYPAFSALPAPQILSPSGSTVRQADNSVKFSWASVTGAASYSLSGYALNSDGSTNWAQQIIAQDATTQAASNVNGAYSAYTPFTLSSPPPTNTSIPQPITPSGNTARQTDNSVKFSWTSVINAVSYYISGYGADSNGIINWTQEIVAQSVTTQTANCATGPTCFISVPVNANSGTWKVRAIYANNVKGDYSDYTNFTLNTPSDTGNLPASVSYDNWNPANPAAMLIPSFQNYQVDSNTSKKVWRLGGTQTEMNAAKTYPNGINSIQSLHAQHFYSRSPVTNKDETLAIGNSANRSGYAPLWRLSDKKLVNWIPASSYSDSDSSATSSRTYHEKQILWDKTTNNVYWYIKNNQLFRNTINLTNFAVTSTLYDTFSNYNYITFGNGEGNFSDDGNKIIIIGIYSNNADSYIIPYTISSKNKGTTKLVSGNASGASMDWASVDPTGEFIVFNTPTGTNPASTWVVPFSNILGTPRLLYTDTKHSDFTIDKNGVPWIVLGNWKGVVAINLSSSLMKRVWPTSETNSAGDGNIQFGSDPIDSIRTTASGHISRVSGRPGMVLVSRHMDGGLYLINIDKSQESIYVGNSRHGLPYKPSYAPSIEAWGIDSAGEPDGHESYKREPRGNASSSGRYIFFVSDYHAYGNTYDTEPPMTAFLNMIELW